MISKIIDFFKHKKGNAHFIRYKYAHIINIDKFSLPFIEFMNEHFDNKKQCFIYLMPKGSPFQIPVWYKNVIVIDNPEDLVFDLKKTKKIFLHSLNPATTIPYLYRNKFLLDCCYWIVWGYDIYNKTDSKQALYVKNNVKAVITTFDKNIYQAKYNQDKKVIELPFYPSVIKQSFLDIPVNRNNDCITIQINNSADDSTLEMLDVLAKFKNEYIKIITVLSYAKKEYNNEILTKGKNIFKDKFYALTEYLSPEKYAEYIRNTDILILNQNRQQGVGNIRCNLYLGHKVFIRKEVNTYERFISQGFKIFDTNTIKDMTFNEFIELSETDKEINKKLVREHFGNSAIAKNWEIFYND